MIIGVPKEIKEEEYRVALTPEGAQALTEAGYKVIVEKNAGLGSGFEDNNYRQAGAEIIDDARQVWQSDLIVKVKEPQKSEYDLLKPGQTLFTYLHLASFPELVKVLKSKNITAIAYATVELEDGSLPLLKPMSEVAGRLAPQVGAYYLSKIGGGRGVLLGGTETVEPAKVVIIGGGVVGANAAEIALGMGAQVTIIDKDSQKIKSLEDKFSYFSKRFLATLSPPDSDSMKDIVAAADLLIGAVLIAGAAAPKIVTREMVRQMKKGSVIVDVAIDQGGCVETSRPTSHKNPIYVEEGVIHYCVTNMPGIVPRTSTLALTNATLTYILEIAMKGPKRAIKENPALTKGLNIYQGKITHPKLAESLDEEYTEPRTLL